MSEKKFDKLNKIIKKLKKISKDEISILNKKNNDLNTLSDLEKQKRVVTRGLSKDNQSLEDNLEKKEKLINEIFKEEPTKSFNAVKNSIEFEKTDSKPLLNEIKNLKKFFYNKWSALEKKEYVFNETIFVDNNKFLSDTRLELKNLKNSNITITEKTESTCFNEVNLEKNLSTENFTECCNRLSKVIDYPISLTNSFEEIDLGRVDVIKFLEFAENNRQSRGESTEEFIGNFTEVLQQSEQGVEHLLAILTKIIELLV